MRLIQYGYLITATILSSLAVLFVSAASAFFIYSPEAPEELLKK
ncbi:cyclic lactone autoinducer peptide [Paenibacillus hunanensis]|uniref:Cyclic lactone autoinducer peptide n=1 Tax=Paenibacillus hunanensis TaxID=539262 RepID=A0ABU1J3Z9_9BACL|nr:cyclic lactone autoinducer peptide [Paenibacillus hunanensis]MDR6245692.1 cyclic lactone autoinducer peptide [Paenibacillus hunanensis]GGJ20085.1 hypothetical protein GCM10008022_31550 [Paenibacillus hunanensis]